MENERRWEIFRRWEFRTAILGTHETVSRSDGNTSILHLEYGERTKALENHVQGVFPFFW